MNPNDIYLQKFTAQNVFVEAPLSVQPNGIVTTDALGNLIIVPMSQVSASYAKTASYALNGGISGSASVSSSYSLTSSYTLNGSFGNLDGGVSNSVYGGTINIDGGLS